MLFPQNLFMMKIILSVILLILFSLSTIAQTVRLELPSLSEGETIIEHTGYTLSFDEQTLCPKWVAWELTAEEVVGVVPRSKDFFPDPLLPVALQVQPTDYRGFGYDRGHMCPAADMKWSAEAMHECFYMSNMCPQDRTLNGVGWERLESACRRWAQQEGSVFIVCGPVYYPDSTVQTIGPMERKIRVPDAFFKVVLSTRTDHEKALGFVYINDSRKQNMGEVCCSVDEIEKITGYDFFPSLEDGLEKRVESMNKLSVWK